MRWVLVLFFLVVAAPAMASAGPRIAVVDFQRAVMETDEGKAAQQQLDTMYESRKREIDRLRQEFETSLQDYQSRAMVLSEQGRAQAERELAVKQQRFEQLYMQYQQEMQQAYFTMLQDLDEKMRLLTERLARERNFDLVIDQMAVVFVGPGAVDLTDDLIQHYNRSQQ